MTDSVDPKSPAGNSQQAWTRDTVLKEAQTLYREAPESSVKLKCLEMILELLPPEQKKSATLSLFDAASEARKAVKGKS